MNDELAAVNRELRSTIEAQAQSNRDLRHLIDCAGIAAICLDPSLRIRLFTPLVRDLFQVDQADIGRSLSDVPCRIAYDDLDRALHEATTQGTHVEREVDGSQGRRYVMQVVPYFTPDNRFDGVVLSFLDIAERKRAEEDLRRSEEHMRLVLESLAEHAIITLDDAGTIVDWNVSAERMFGFSRREAVGEATDLIFTPEDRARGVHLEEMRIARTQGCAAVERWHVRKDGSRLYVSGILSPIGLDRSGGYVKVARDRTEHRQPEEALHRAHDPLESRVVERTQELASELSERRQAEERVRKLLSRLITVQEDERRRIARDLHDDLGQKMTALHLKLDALRRGIEARAPSALEQAREAQAFVQQLDRDLDFFTWELRPAALYDLGLMQALRDFVEQWTKNYGVPCDFEAINVGSNRWRPDIEINLYRIAQEALNNVHKHARATKVGVLLQRRNRELILSIEDNGVGFDQTARVEPRGRGIGLISMRERAGLIGGSLEIERAASGGTTVIVRAPAASDSGVHSSADVVR